MTGSAVAAQPPKSKSKAATPPAAPAVVDETPSGDRVVMVLDGEPYTQSELAKFYTLRMGKPFRPKDLSRDEMNSLLHQYSLQEMVKREASAAGFTTSDADVEAYIDEIKKQNGMNDQDLSKFLHDKGLTREGYVDQIKFEIVRNRLFAAKVRPKVALADEEAARLQKELQTKDEEAAADGIVVEQLIYPAVTDKAEIDKIYERAKGGEDLKAIGGDAHFADLGVVNPDDLREELRDIVADLSVGDVSKPLSLDGSWIIYKRVKSLRVGSTIPTVAAANDATKSEQFERKFKEAADKYLGEELPKKYNPEFKI
jgi:parvulin-like peptidyl-prolyl isomerase